MGPVPQIRESVVTPCLSIKREVKGCSKIDSYQGTSFAIDKSGRNETEIR